MRDAEFEFFISNFGEATSKRAVLANDYEKWRGHLPDKLLSCWESDGWCGYQEGLFWIVNPTDYEDLVAEWLAETPLPRIDRFHVIARSAFGELYLCGENCGRVAMINCPFNGVIAVPSELRPKTSTERDQTIAAFFISGDPSDYDFDDSDGEPLFSRALEKLGPLSEDEMYGFEPALVAGGTNDLAHLRKVKIDQHLTILRQLASPSIPFGNVDIEKLGG